MYLGRHERGGVLSTVFNEIIEGELNSMEKRMGEIKRNLGRSSGDVELDEINRIVYSSVLSYLRSEYSEMRKYGLTVNMSRASDSPEYVGFTET